VKPGYKKTEVGVIPQDWRVVSIGSIAAVGRGRVISHRDIARARNPQYPIYSSQTSNDGVMGYIDTFDFEGEYVTWTTDGENAGTVFARTGRFNCTNVCGTIKLRSDNHIFVARSLSQVAQSHVSRHVGNPKLMNDIMKRVQIPLPPTRGEQDAIAEALSDVDALLGALDRLIAKKRDLKQAAMQQLLTGQTRLPGFSGEWETKTLEESTDCLDGLRVPLNETQRAGMRGEYPYCGANGVLDFVNDFVIDDDIILMAEDGGYFDEYEYRPIAYRMSGKCWVNNHAHILKAKSGFDQGFIFYSLVHKNILPFLASGTRAKLNKSEMKKIEVRLPMDLPEQSAIAAVLSDMDAELEALEQRRAKTAVLKQGMMQELLTGRTRLV